MNRAQALHTAARRYCMVQYKFWREKYWFELVEKGLTRSGSAYTPEALAMFPRYNVLNAVLIEVERIDSETLTDLEKAREDLILAGKLGEDVSTSGPKDEISSKTMADERERFCNFLLQQTADSLKEIAPLPFRRVLSRAERDSVWAKVRDRWQIIEPWFPLDIDSRADLFTFKAKAFETGVQASTLKEFLTARRIIRLWELREFGADYTESIEWFEPVYYNGAEGFWSSEGFDWFVFASHESSITVGGWLLDSIRKIWPSWQEHAWSPANIG